MPITAVEPAHPLSTDAGEHRPTDDRPRREDRATTFGAALAQAVAEDREWKQG
jgi:hypothetical protein